MRTDKQIKQVKNLIIAASIAIPLVVALLFKVNIKGVDTHFLPAVYAAINGLTALMLILSVVKIKNGNRKAHENLMKFSMVLSLLFLLLYITYHMTSESTAYGGEGFLKYIYFFILATHISLSMLVVPLVLFSYFRAWKGDYEAHKKIVKFAFPLWLYVAVSGVVVYFMIAPYYA